PPEARANADLVRSLESLVSNEFIYKTPGVKLFNGATAGIREALVAKKKPMIALKMAPLTADTDAAASVFTKDYYAVAEKYPDLLKDNFLQGAAIKGMLKVLDDQYTVYMNPAEYGSLKEAMNGGNFGGLGIYIELDKKNNDALTVVEPIEDTPASRGGILPRDVIIAIDGHDTTKVTIDGAQKYLRGEVGSPVKLTIRREGKPEPVVITLNRDRIRVSSVKHKMVEENGVKVGYVSLKIFGDFTNQEMEAALRDCEKQGAQALVFDLRNNGGGYITAAVDVCSKFLPTGSKVVSVEERGEGVATYESHPNLHKHLPLVLLVNEYSASASEITAGAMKDTQRAKLIGVKTFGKGSVQKIFPLPDGSALKVTTAHYHTPSGRDINKIGIEPDIKVEMPIQKLGSTDDMQYKSALQEVVKEVKDGPAEATSQTGTDNSVRLASINDEIEALDAQRAQGFEVTRRKMVREADSLFEDVTLR
ncbi:unnamed protein product, partial [Phaeothamnion confervicola]